MKGIINFPDASIDYIDLMLITSLCNSIRALLLIHTKYAYL